MSLMRGSHDCNGHTVVWHCLLCAAPCCRGAGVGNPAERRRQRRSSRKSGTGVVSAQNGE